jgi:hypothetical protein
VYPLLGFPSGFPAKNVQAYTLLIYPMRAICLAQSIVIALITFKIFVKSTNYEDIHHEFSPSSCYFLP